MKRLLIILLFSLTLVACGGGGSSSKKGSTNTDPGGTQLSQSTWGEMKWDEGVWD